MSEGQASHTGITRWLTCLMSCISLFVLSACVEDPPTHQGAASEVPAGFLPATQLNDDWLATLQRGLPDGLTAAVIGDNENRLLLIDVNTGKYTPAILSNPDEGISALAALEEANAALVIGSGFVAAAHSLTPVGLLQLEGNVISPVQVHGYTRILGINDDGLGVVHRRDYQRELFHSALQVGPGIVESGALDISARDLERPRYFRSFVAVCSDRWITGVSLAPTHLRTLGETFLQHAETQGLACGEVVNFAGDRQAVLLAATDEGAVFAHGDAKTYKLSLVGFIPN